MSSDRSSGSGGGRPANHGDYPADLGERERYVLSCLADHGTMALRDLADEVIVWERNASLPDVPPDECRTTYLSLYHTHVPRLERAGLVESADGLVTPTEAARGIAGAEPTRPAGE